MVKGSRQLGRNNADKEGRLARATHYIYVLGTACIDGGDTWFFVLESSHICLHRVWNKLSDSRTYFKKGLV